VVALGASAGGLDALTQFFSAVAADCGMAFVVVQHLAPNRPSTLPELLSRHTGMKTVVIEDGLRLAPNCVHVIPPGQFLSVEHGVLRLSAPPGDHRMPIDYFLRSLASDSRERAFAVILSGTGTDGTLGVQAVKAADGLVAVQAPNTADYAGMPTSAIGTGQVDFILPADDIPRALLQYARRAFGASGQAELRPPEEQFRALSEIFLLLRKRSRHDFSGYKKSTVLRRIARRMAVHAADDLWSYLRLLREQPEELDRLFAELLIPVTAFFRDEEAFAALEKTVLPRLLECSAGNAALRVWVPGCSTGEEAYSLAIAITEAMDRLKQYPSVQIFATDIDSAALVTARKGRYPASIAPNVGEDRLRRYFVRDGEYFEVSKTIREMLVFATQDVLKDPPFSRVDLISCRNLLIYLGLDLQRQLLPVFHYALNPNGFLFLGTAETVGNLDDLFAVVDSRWKIYARRPDEFARRAYLSLPQFAVQHDTAKATTADTNDRQIPDYGEVVQRMLLRDHVPAAALIDGHNQLLYLHGNAGIVLVPAVGQPSADILRMTRPGLEGLVRSTIQTARTQRGAISRVAQVAVAGGSPLRVRITGRAVEEPETPANAILLLMDELGPAGVANMDGVEASSSEEPGAQTAALETELAETREALQATIEELETANEELQSSNEELQSSNEELQSSNEELETSREELQSVNDELRSVNAELQEKVEDSTRAREEMNMLLASTDIGIVFVDTLLRIERFTPAVTAIIPVRESDIGRPIDDLSHKLRYERLRQDVEEVLTSLGHRQHRVHGSDDHLYIIRMRPHRTPSGRVIGAVLVFIDVTEEADVAFLGKLRDALGQSEDLIMLVNLEGSIEYINEAFCEATGYAVEDVVGKVPDVLTSPAMDEADRRRMSWCLRHGRTWRGEFHCLCRDGSSLPTQAFFAPIRSSSGQVTHAVAYMQPTGGSLTPSP